MKFNEEIQQAAKILMDVCKKYISEEKSAFLWDKLNDFAVISDPGGWSYINEFVGENECLMFF